MISFGIGRGCLLAMLVDTVWVEVVVTIGVKLERKLSPCCCSEGKPDRRAARTALACGIGLGFFPPPP